MTASAIAFGLAAVQRRLVGPCRTLMSWLQLSAGCRISVDVAHGLVSLRA